MANKSPAELEKEIADLKEKLNISEKARSEAEELALSGSQVSHLLGEGGQEHPTGKVIKRKVCVNPEAPKKEQEWIEQELPTYFYTINLPVSAVSLSTNGIEVFHGQTIEVDIHQLAEYKSRVARCWDHEKSISGSNENAYRKQTQLRVG